MKPQDVKTALGHPVTYRSTKYTMTAYILRKMDGRLLYQAELQDSNGNSIVIAPLESVNEL
ncbi:hypothetical protein FL966_01710 [Caproiciproducens galactitolivorans]|uniref:PepSY domain-containing protein n=1 Tax=Caproiciproducens galactitolivorans TaxID=642589 RepID=A0A4Z0YBZ3_9FIRM|nr:hypothetical protein [Caproiciproducens galactitolivorans]QEY33861.1 hypothetical protein FL966_01710 [Caproiciproducens galactitolivorans]TGJ75366.1 hypothetical protein CAGA_24640 [Caproiciproducens galactitolivorans]